MIRAEWIIFNLELKVNVSLDKRFKGNRLISLCFCDFYINYCEMLGNYFFNVNEITEQQLT